MTEVSADALYAFLAASPELDKAETDLRAQSEGKLADKLNKLQQDAGVDQVDFSNDIADPAGPSTAHLKTTFSPFTEERVQSVLREVHAAISNEQSMRAIASLMEEIKITPASYQINVKPPSPNPQTP